MSRHSRIARRDRLSRSSVGLAIGDGRNRRADPRTHARESWSNRNYQPRLVSRLTLAISSPRRFERVVGHRYTQGRMRVETIAGQKRLYRERSLPFVYV